MAVANNNRPDAGIKLTEMAASGKIPVEDLNDEKMGSQMPAKTLASLLLPKLGDMSQEELAERAALGRSTVYKIFNNTMRPRRIH